jgi:hypothetical protein
MNVIFVVVYTLHFTMYTVANKTHLVFSKSKVDKYKYDIVDDKGNQYVVIAWHDLYKPIVYDKQYDALFHGINITCATNYYALCRIPEADEHMHRVIGTQMFPNIRDTRLTIDHINWVKTDNRAANLRLATQSEQNSNRGTRSDKIPPLSELQAIGVDEYPKHVRWDKSEEKFVIEKHPALMREVSLGLRKKPIVSGTKSARFSVVEKYQDILAKLQDLDAREDDEEFRTLRAKLLAEYNAIVECVRSYDGVNNVIDQPAASHSSPGVEASHKTVAGRKAESKLPEGCGVTLDMLPKYTYYRPASATRGDCFIIDRHPNMTDGRLWSTTASRKVSTRDKYDALMDKYASL